MLTAERAGVFFPSHEIVHRDPLWQCTRGDGVDYPCRAQIADGQGAAHGRRRGLGHGIGTGALERFCYHVGLTGDWNREAQALQTQIPGVYIAMNGCVFPPGRVRKNREAGRFESI